MRTLLVRSLTIWLIITFSTIFVLEWRWVVMNIIFSFICEIVPSCTSIWRWQSPATVRHLFSILTDYVVASNWECIIGSLPDALLLVHCWAARFGALRIHLMNSAIQGTSTFPSTRPFIIVEAGLARISWQVVLELSRSVTVMDFRSQYGTSWSSEILRCTVESPYVVGFRVIILEQWSIWDYSVSWSNFFLRVTLLHGCLQKDLAQRYWLVLILWYLHVWW